MIFNDEHRNFAIDPVEIQGEVRSTDWSAVFGIIIAIAAVLYFGGHLVAWYMGGCPVSTPEMTVVYQCER